MLLQEYFAVNLITEVPRINSALYFPFASDSVNMKILGDHLLTKTVAVLSKPTVKGIAALMFYFLGYLVSVKLSLDYFDTILFSALLSSSVSKLSS